MNAHLARLWLRVACAAALAAVALTAMLHRSAYRGWEALAEGWVVRTFSHLPATVTPDRATVWAGADSSTWGLTITPACSSALLIAGFGLIGAVIVAIRSSQPQRVVLGALVAMAIVFAVNMLRLSVLVIAKFGWGETAFEIAHVYVGTAITLAGTIAAVIALMKVLSTGRPASSARHAGTV